VQRRVVCLQWEFFYFIYYGFALSDVCVGFFFQRGFGVLFLLSIASGGRALEQHLHYLLPQITIFGGSLLRLDFYRNISL
jgi:hypothetical protein